MSISEWKLFEKDQTLAWNARKSAIQEKINVGSFAKTRENERSRISVR